MTGPGELVNRLSDLTEHDKDARLNETTARRQGMQLAEEADILRGSLREYTRAAWHVIEPGTRFVSNWHIDCISEAVEAAYNREILRLLLNVPPRHMKSLTTSVLGPTWQWTRKPEERFLTASYAIDLAQRDAVKSRDLIRSGWYQARFGDMVKLKADVNQKTRYENTRAGYRIATSVGGAGTGEGGDILQIDDPLKGEDAYSAAARQEVLRWWGGTWATRLNDIQTGVKIVIMQRLHEEDLTGHIIASEYDDWTHICLPAEYDPGHPFVCPKEIPTGSGASGRLIPGDPRTVEGELLWPEKMPAHELAKVKRTMGSLLAAGQLQQRPAPAEGAIFKTGLIRTWKALSEGVYDLGEGHVVNRTDCWRMTICDLATSVQTYSDYTVVGTFDVTPRGEVLTVGWRRAKLEGPDVKQLIRGVYAQMGPDVLGVEAVGFQLSVVQELRREGIPVIKLDAEKDKISRAIAGAAKIEAGQFYVEDNATYLGDLFYELVGFPAAKHDDQVDVVSHACIEANKRGYNWDDAYGIIRCPSCGHGYVLEPKTRPCPKCGTPPPEH